MTILMIKTKKQQQPKNTRKIKSNGIIYNSKYTSSIMLYRSTFELLTNLVPKGVTYNNFILKVISTLKENDLIDKVSNRNNYL